MFYTHRGHRPSFLKRLFVVRGAALLWSLPLSPQQDITSEQRKRIVLTDSSELIGTVVVQAPDTIQFRTTGGIVVIIPTSMVRRTQQLLEREKITNDRPERYSTVFFRPQLVR